MSAFKPVAYDVAESDDSIIVVLRCEPMKGILVRASELGARGFEISDALGSVLRLGNPHPRIRKDPRPISLAIMHDGVVDLMSVPSRMDGGAVPEPMEEGQGLDAAMPKRFLWHHDHVPAAGDLLHRPLAELLMGFGDTMVCIMCSTPVGHPVSAVMRQRMVALPAGRTWASPAKGLVVDVDALTSPIVVPDSVDEAIATAFGDGHDRQEAPTTWRSQVALRLPG